MNASIRSAPVQHPLSQNRAKTRNLSYAAFCRPMHGSTAYPVSDIRPEFPVSQAPAFSALNWGALR